MISWFENLVGKENISDEIVEREVYSTDGSGIFGNTDKVIWAETVKQIHQLVLYARRNKLCLIPRGAGTNCVGGVVPERAIVIDFSKMNTVLGMENDSVVVQPGVILDDLNAYLKKKNKFFPIVPEDSAVCTIGGMCGVNSFGYYSKRFWRMEDWVLDVEMIDGCGKLRKVARDVIGSEGCFGIFTCITLGIIDLIQERSMDVFKFSQLEEALSKLSVLLHDHDCLSVEFLSPRTAVLIGLEPKSYLLVEYLGLKGSVSREGDMYNILQIRKNAFSKVARQGYFHLEDVTVPFHYLPELIYWLEKKGYPSYGPLGFHVLYSCFDHKDIIAEFLAFVHSLEGKSGYVSGVGLTKKESLSDNAKNEFLKQKERFDPVNILNKGKVISWQV